MLAPLNTAPQAAHTQTRTPARTYAHAIAIYLTIKDICVGEGCALGCFWPFARVSHGRKIESGRPIE